MKGLLTLVIVMTLSVTLSYAQKVVTGQIMDDSDEPLIGANVIAPGTTVGTVTDFDGKFELSVPEGIETLIISYTGFSDYELDISQGNNFDVVLQEGILLGDVVVVGYGEQSKKQLVSSISTVSDEQIQKISAAGPQALLQGQASGVQFNSGSGVLGSAPSLRIRGVASLSAGGQPLFVVDGVPLNDGGGSEDGSYSERSGSGSGLNPLLNIPAEDIESISILKDAAAASIYGSRGSNGVVLINTKKGRAGTNEILFNASYAIGNEVDKYDMTNSEQYYEIVNQFRGTAIPSEIPYFDWVDGVLQSSQTFSTSLAFRGGNETTTYYLGGAFTDDQNYVIGNDLENLSGRLNLTHKVSDRLKVGGNIGIGRVTTDRIGAENNTQAPLTSAYLQLPTVLPRNEDGSYTRTGFIQNVIAREDVSLRQLISRRTTGNVYADFDIAKFGESIISFKTDWGIDEIQTEETRRDPDIIDLGGYGYRQIYRDNKWLTTNTLNYATPVGFNSFFKILVGQSFETSLLEQTAVEGRGFAADALRNVASAATPSTTEARREEWALASFFARANYDINNKYFVEGTYRRDGSSRFGVDNRWGNFWAVGAGWSLSDEPFMANQNLFDNLKLKVSYGLTGNDRVGYYDAKGLYEAGPLSDYDGEAGLRPTQAANPDLKWEETAQLDVSLNMTIKRKLDLNVSYYIKKTSDLLLDVPLPLVDGFESISQNIGEMENRGIDIDLNWDIYRDQNWSISFGGNFNYLQNEITKLDQNSAVDDFGNQFVVGTGFSASNTQRAVVGKTANEFFLVRYHGVNPQTGDAEWLDVDGNVTTTYSTANRVYVGSALPDWTGGLNLDADYKGLNLSMFWNYSLGNDVILDELRFTENPVSGFNKSTDLLNYWKQEGDQAFAPSPNSSTANFFAQRSTLQLQNGSYMRLKNLTLAYNLPLGKMGGISEHISSLRIYATGTNLITIKDPDFRGQEVEVSDTGGDNFVQGESFFVAPQRKMYKFGINVTF